MALLILVSRKASGQPAQPQPQPQPQSQPQPNLGTAMTSLGLSEVLLSVDQSFPLILAAAREQDEARGTQLSAAGGFDPSFRLSGTYEPISGYPKQYMTAQIDQPTAIWGTSFFAGYRYGSGKIPIYEGKLETNEFGEARGGARIPLLRDGSIDRRRASIRQGELGVLLAKLTTQQQRIEARRLASLRYWDWVVAGRRLTILRTWLAFAVDRDAGLATRAERGDIPDIDRTENQRTIFQRQAAVIAGERDLEQASAELAVYWRDKNGTSSLPTTQQLPQMLPEVPAASVDPLRSVDSVGGAENATKLALERRPDLKRLDVTRDRSRVEADLAVNQLLPSVDVTLFAAKQFGPGDVARGEPVAGAALFLDIPILNRVQSGRRDAAEAQISKTEEQKRFLKDRIVADVRIALVTIDASRRRAAAANKEVGVAETLAKAELRRFELGEGNLLLVNLREQATAEASIREVDAVADYHRAVANFRAASAKDL